MGAVDFHRYADPPELARSAALDWVRAVSSRPSSAGFSAALSGGRVAGVFFSTLTSEIKGRALSLAGVHFFWSDERCVPPDDPESNFRLAHELCLKPLNVLPGQVHRIPGEKPPSEACSAATSELLGLVALGQDGQPVLDLVILGMGEDGHVASLFPGETDETMASPAVFRSVTAAKPPPLRITLGYPAIFAARQVWVLASGAGKRNALRASLEEKGQTPLARVIKLRASTRIYSDIAS